MRKRFLGMACFLAVAMVRLVLAQDSINAPSKLLVYPKDKTQRELGLLPSKQLRQPMPPKRTGKIKGLSSSAAGKNSIPNQVPVKSTLGPGKNQLVDKNGQPVTLWPAGQKKSYSTIYQDPK